MKLSKLYKEVEFGRYFLWGIITVAFNYISYLLFEFFVGYKIGNLLSIISTKIFAYFTNKKYVFKTNTNLYQQIKEVIRYILGRTFTGIIDFGGLILLTDYVMINDKIGKIIMIIITTLINYCVGKLFVFKKIIN